MEWALRLEEAKEIEYSSRYLYLHRSLTYAFLVLSLVTSSSSHSRLPLSLLRAFVV